MMPAMSSSTSVTPEPTRTPPRFQGRGVLLEGALYIERTADRRLVETLARGEHCHVLAPRQIGKTNLRIRAAAALEARGVRCVQVDLQAIGRGANEVQWYSGIVKMIVGGLGLKVDTDAFWKKQERLDLPQAWSELMRAEVLGRIEAPVVLFIDELEHGPEREDPEERVLPEHPRHAGRPRIARGLEPPHHLPRRHRRPFDAHRGRRPGPFQEEHPDPARRLLAERDRQRVPRARQSGR